MVLERTPAMPAEEVALGDARGRVLAEPVDAGAEAVPGFDNSAMDGYAVRAADAAGAAEASPVSLRISGESRAGHPAEGELAAGEAIAISTGAMVPAGADAVVRVEDTRGTGDAVEILAPPADGANIRRAGEDIRARRAPDRARHRALGGRARGRRLGRSRRARLRPAPARRHSRDRRRTGRPR